MTEYFHITSLQRHQLSLSLTRSLALNQTKLIDDRDDDNSVSNRWYKISDGVMWIKRARKCVPRVHFTAMLRFITRLFICSSLSKFLTNIAHIDTSRSLLSSINFAQLGKTLSACLALISKASQPKYWDHNLLTHNVLSASFFDHKPSLLFPSFLKRDDKDRTKG